MTADVLGVPYCAYPRHFYQWKALDWLGSHQQGKEMKLELISSFQFFQSISIEQPKMITHLLFFFHLSHTVM